MGHYANECRSQTSTASHPTFRNPVNNRDKKPVVIKKEYQGQVRFCTYYHSNAIEDDLVNVGDLDNEVNLETENELRNTKDIGDEEDGLKKVR
ncbi:hypothetical protein ACI65C_013327 [Semiaphis heraclei]